MGNKSFCQRVIEAADARQGKVAMTLIRPDGAEMTTFGEMLKLGRKEVSQLPVVSRKDASKLLGIITLHDIAEALSKEDEGGFAENEDKA